MGTTTFLGAAILNEVFRATNYAPPSTVYVSLHTADPGDNGANEVTVGAFPAYAREDAAQGGAATAAWGAPSSNQISNLLELLWEIHNGAGAITVTHFGLWDAASGGNCLYTGAVTASKTLNVGDQFVIRVGDLDVSVA
ncbi:phage tail fiber protein [Hoeflea poritis]|uniref:Uncharacterized protein n=1 Tax=Hoeflea poritis TaxID=2993659 RepID=A0ABT4VMW5_9HYPH|nr:hypothetical protein [Hoeflea poritis]MDA4845949.1 hypothetical protein [Hoeflea poritis]